MPLWNPSFISTRLWLDAADSRTLFDSTSGGNLVGTGGAVARWEDKSGNGFHVTQSTSSQRPNRQAAIQNSLDVLRFDGNDRLTNASLLSSQPNSVFIVGRVDSSDSDAAVFLDSLNSSQHVVYRGSSTDNPGAFVAAGGASRPLAGAANTNFNVHAAVFNSTSGLYVLNGDNSTSGSIGTNALNGVSIGDLRGNPSPLVSGYALIGDIAEVIILNSATPAPIRQLIEGYLAWKWGLQASLPTSHPYKSFAPFFENGLGGEVGWWCPSRDDRGNLTSVLYDLSRSGFYGTLTNMDAATDWVADTSNGGIRALDFDGVNDMVSFASYPSLTTIATQSFWFKRGAVSQNGPGVGFGTIGSTANRFVVQVWNDGFIYVSFTGSAWCRFSSNDLNWHHLVVVFDGSQTGNSNRCRVWLDGVAVTLTFTGTIPATLGAYNALRIAQTFIGSAGGNDPFGQGLLDDYRVFPRAVSSTEIPILYSTRGFSSQQINGIGGEIFWICPSLDTLGNGTTLARDLTSSGNNGTLTNMEPLTDWVSSGGLFALDFDGTNDFVRANHTLSTVSWSVSCWVLIRSFASTRTVWSQGTAAAGTYITLRTNTSSQFFFSVDGVLTTVTSASSYNTNQWYHTCLTHAEGVTTLFIDAVQQATQTKADDLTADNFTLGSTPIAAGAFFLDGQIDDCRTFNRALAQTEITALASQRGYQRPSNTRRRRYTGGYGL